MGKGNTLLVITVDPLKRLNIHLLNCFKDCALINTDFTSDEVIQ